jgi:hypothetical protein
VWEPIEVSGRYELKKQADEAARLEAEQIAEEEARNNASQNGDPNGPPNDGPDGLPAPGTSENQEPPGEAPNNQGPPPGN